ncbi:tetraacyldisaccharide 4'-kinase [Christiangramia forsetii]|uniref:Tetraacyldisaccharide 4'-kinase n=2 Tax=Christiangramia forsetii TaxID=411153 RepID=A0M4W7_CHRFK|nr:tetraacyldisaccharide 4'-kinase [Christiangramia forsetii]GGG22465.1 tetraacyldisaccharide 4'-kinase [Christiangramia forsetii]CAL67662.1 tetraacyldisaccharide 4'-kinase [Christiangramia forsetii KT0803]
MPNPRKLLYPFSVIYHGVTEVRNKLYDADIFKSESYNIPVIAVGNLNMGGTGKSPMIEYLLRTIGKDKKIATLSRGYKRESKGFQLVQIDDSASKVGDEPLQFKNKYPETLVAVDANRREGIAELMKFSPDVILLDDAFQHRKVKAGFYILLTAFDDLYINDLLLPGGNLRESASGASRADVIVVTKCPEDLSENKMKEFEKQLKPSPNQKIYFSSIGYSDKVFSMKNSSGVELRDIKGRDFSLVTGIANPKPLLEYLRQNEINFNHLKFSDHHNFNSTEIKELQGLSEIITTEKDYMRLKDRLPADKLFYLPIQVDFLRDRGKFDSKIFRFINKK